MEQWHTALKITKQKCSESSWQVNKKALISTDISKQHTCDKITVIVTGRFARQVRGLSLYCWLLLAGKRWCSKWWLSDRTVLKGEIHQLYQTICEWSECSSWDACISYQICPVCWRRLRSRSPTKLNLHVPTWPGPCSGRPLGCSHHSRCALGEDEVSILFFDSALEVSRRCAK